VAVLVHRAAQLGPVRDAHHDSPSGEGAVVHADDERTVGVDSHDSMLAFTSSVRTRSAAVTAARGRAGTPRRRAPSATPRRSPAASAACRGPTARDAV